MDWMQGASALKLCNSKASAPCRGCATRFMGCHGVCELYMEYRKQVDEETAVYKASQLARYEICEYTRDSKERMRAKKEHDKAPPRKTPK